MKLPCAICFIILKAENKGFSCRMKCAWFCSDFSVVLVGGFSLETQTKPYPPWLDRADTTVNSALCEIHALFFGWF